MTSPNAGRQAEAWVHIHTYMHIAILVILPVVVTKCLDKSNFTYIKDFFGPQLEVIVHQGRKVRATGTVGSGLHCKHSPAIE